MDKESYHKITRPQNTCVRCGVALAEAGKHPSAIRQAQSEEEGAASDEPVRDDYCPSCWSEFEGNEYFSYWLARREKPKAKPIQNRKERNATLLSYFEFLMQQNDPEYAQHIFFLSHLLMKYSVFRWVRNEPPTETGGSERIVFKNTVTDDLVTVESVQLDDERIVVIKKEIDEFLARGQSTAAEVAE